MAPRQGPGWLCRRRSSVWAAASASWARACPPLSLHPSWDRRREQLLTSSSSFFFFSPSSITTPPRGYYRRSVAPGADLQCKGDGQLSRAFHSWRAFLRTSFESELRVTGCNGEEADIMRVSGFQFFFFFFFFRGWLREGLVMESCDAISKNIASLCFKRSVI